MIDVYVPLPGTVAWEHIDQGSGIVGALDTNGTIRLYFEGNRYGYVNVKTYADRVKIAADRQRQRYPTVAQMNVKSSDVRRIGGYAGGQVVLAAMADHATLAKWLGVDELDLDELRVSS
jgi:hypothetical protein